MRTPMLIALAALLVVACAPKTQYDVLIHSGTIYDGSGQPGLVGDLAIDGDSIVAVGNVPNARGRTEIDAKGLAVAPGFINMLSHSERSLIGANPEPTAPARGWVVVPDGHPDLDEGSVLVIVGAIGLVFNVVLASVAHNIVGPPGTHAFNVRLHAAGTLVVIVLMFSLARIGLGLTHRCHDALATAGRWLNVAAVILWVLFALGGALVIRDLWSW